MGRTVMKLRPGHPVGAMSVHLEDGSCVSLTAEPLEVPAGLAADDADRLAKWVEVSEAEETDSGSDGPNPDDPPTDDLPPTDEPPLPEVPLTPAQKRAAKAAEKAAKEQGE